MAPTIPAAPGEEELPVLPLDLRLRLAELFVRMDADGSHGLTREELKSAFRALGMGSSEDELEERASAVSAMDSNGDSFVSFTEFMRGMTSVYRAGLAEKEKVSAELLAALDPAAERFTNDEVFRALEHPRVVSACKGLRAQDPHYPTYHDYLLRTLRSNGLFLTGRMTRAQLLAAIDAAEPPVLPTQARIRELLDTAAAASGEAGDAADSDVVPLDRRRGSKGAASSDGSSGFGAFAGNAGTAVSDSATSVGDFFLSIFTCGSVRVLKKQPQLEGKAMQLAVSSAPHGSSSGSSSVDGSLDGSSALDGGLDVRQVWGSPEEVEAARIDAARREALARVKGLGAGSGTGTTPEASSAGIGSSPAAATAQGSGGTIAATGATPSAAAAPAAQAGSSGQQIPASPTFAVSSSGQAVAAGLGAKRPTLQPASTTSQSAPFLSSSSSSSSSSGAYGLSTPGSVTAASASTSAVLPSSQTSRQSRAERIAADLAARAREAEIAFSLEAHASGRVL